MQRNIFGGIDYHILSPGQNNRAHPNKHYKDISIGQSRTTFQEIEDFSEKQLSSSSLDLSKHFISKINC